MMEEFKLKSGVTVTVRKFEPRDSSSCSNLLNRSFKIASPIPDFATKLYENELAAYRSGNIQKTAHKRDYRIAEVGDQVVGLVGIRKFPPSREVVRTAELFRLPAAYIDAHRPAAAEVLDLVVADGFRGKKIGTFLTMAALVDKIEEGITYFHAYAPAYAARLLAYGGFAKTSDEADSIRWGKVASFCASVSKESKPRIFEAMEALMQPPGSQFKLHS